MAITKKAQSVIHHLNVAVSGLDKLKIHLLQAKAGLKKSDIDSQSEVQFCMETLDRYEKAIKGATATVEGNNQAAESEE